MSGICIRAFGDGDGSQVSDDDRFDAVIALWQACGLTRPWNDPRADIERCLAADSGFLLIAEGRPPATPIATPTAISAAASAAVLVGTVMGGYDGHRGWMYYLACDPARRGEGIGRALVAEAERRFEVLGCPKAQLMVRGGNETAIGFYEALGYERNDVLVLGRRLIED